MCNFTPSATICRPQQLRPETRHALIEMMRLALKQHAGHDGPVEVNLLPDRSEPGAAAPGFLDAGDLAEEDHQ